MTGESKFRGVIGDYDTGSANQNADSLSQLATNEFLLERGSGV